MKTRFLDRMSSLTRRPAVRLAFPLALLLIATPFSNALQGHGSHHHNQGPTLVGAWNTSATLSVVPPGFPADGKFNAINTYNSDGTMYVVAQLTGVTIGSGVWKQTGPLTYTFTFTFYRLDPSTMTTGKMLPVNVNENVKMTSADTYVTTDIIQPLDASGKVLASFPGTVTGTRYPFQYYNMTQP